MYNSSSSNDKELPTANQNVKYSALFAYNQSKRFFYALLAHSSELALKAN